MSWAPGTLVVCVDDGDIPGSEGCWDVGEEINKDTVYTVARFYLRGDRQTVQLLEVQRTEWARALYGGDIGYNARRFRPVQSLPKSITSLLTAPVPSRRKTEVA